MPTESVEILIEANDLASAKFKQVANNAENTVKQIKDVSGRAKASTEFAGTLANMLGGTELGGFASQLAGLTEKTAQFAEVSKAGGAGALAFKAGLVAATGAVAFGIGKALGDVIFQTEKWKESLADATKEVDRLNAATLVLASKRFDSEKAEISLIRDPEEQLAANKRLLDGIEKQIADKRQQIEAKKNQEESLSEAWLATPEMRRQARDTTLEEKQLDLLRQQADALREQTSERTLNLQARQKENALMDKSDSFLAGLRDEIELLKAKKSELAAIEARRNTFGGSAQIEAVSLLAERDGLKALALKDQLIGKLDQERTLIERGTMAARERELMLQGLAKADAAFVAEQEDALATEKRRIAEADKITEMVERENVALQERAILINEGAEAAHKFRLEMAGLSEEDAKRISHAHAMLTLKEKEAQQDREQGKEKPIDKLIGDDQPLQAVESRLLTRGRGSDKQLVELTNIRAAVREHLEEAKKAREEARRNKAVRMEIVRQ